MTGVTETFVFFNSQLYTIIQAGPSRVFCNPFLWFSHPLKPAGRRQIRFNPRIFCHDF